MSGTDPSRDSEAPRGRQKTKPALGGHSPISAPKGKTTISNSSKLNEQPKQNDEILSLDLDPNDILIHSDAESEKSVTESILESDTEKVTKKATNDKKFDRV